MKIVFDALDAGVAASLVVAWLMLSTFQAVPTA